MAMWKFTNPIIVRGISLNGFKVVNIENLQHDHVTIVYQLGQSTVDDKGKELDFFPVDTKRFTLDGELFLSLANSSPTVGLTRIQDLLGSFYNVVAQHEGESWSGTLTP